MLSIRQPSISRFFQYPYWIIRLESSNSIQNMGSAEPNSSMFINAD